jgi:hypothetical protein
MHKEHSGVAKKDMNRDMLRCLFDPFGLIAGFCR